MSFDNIVANPPPNELTSLNLEAGLLNYSDPTFSEPVLSPPSTSSASSSVASHMPHPASDEVRYSYSYSFIYKAIDSPIGY